MEINDKVKVGSTQGVIIKKQELYKIRFSDGEVSGWISKKYIQENNQDHDPVKENCDLYQDCLCCPDLECVGQNY